MNSTPAIRPQTLHRAASIPSLSLADSDSESTRYDDLVRLVNRLESEISDLRFVVATLQKQLEQRDR